MASAFDGFRPEALDFLVELALNNDRAWFQPRKSDFEALLKEPLEALCTSLDDEFRARGVPLARGCRALAVPHLSRRALLEGQVALQDERRRELPVDRRGRRRRRLLPPRARRHVHRRRHVASGARPAGGLAAGRGRGPGTGPRRARGSRLPDDLRQCRRRPSQAPADRLPARRPRRRAAQAQGRGLRDRRSPTATILASDLPVRLADRLAQAVPVLRLLAALPGHEASARWLRD